MMSPASSFLFSEGVGTPDCHLFFTHYIFLLVSTSLIAIQLLDLLQLWKFLSLSCILQIVLLSKFYSLYILLFMEIGGQYEP